MSKGLLHADALSSCFVPQVERVVFVGGHGAVGDVMAVEMNVLQVG